MSVTLEFYWFAVIFSIVPILATVSFHFRTHSLAIGQVLLDASYIESQTSNSADFIDGLIFYKFTEMAFKSPETDSSPAREFIL